MLRKLLKYDLKYILKFLMIFYSLALVFSVLTRVFLNIENSLVFNIIGQIFNGAAISMMCSSLINNVMCLWARFRRNLYLDESYLTHTLPIEPYKHYLSKIATLVISLFTSIAVITVCIFCAYYSKENLDILKSLLLPIADMFESNAVSFVAMFITVLFLQFANIIQCGFTGIITGHMMNNGKVGFSVLFGFITYIITQGIVLLTVFIIALFKSEMMELFTTNSISDISLLKDTFYICIAIYLAIFIGLAVANIRLLKKGVNVD